MKGTMRFDAPMASYTTFNIGGKADRVFTPRGVSDLSSFLRQCPEEERLTVLGWGSNVLVSDEGVRGTVIITKELKWMRVTGNRVRVGAGVMMPKLLNELAVRGLGGMEFMAGIPGTVGGAVRMNAGTSEGTVADRLISVVSADRAGRLQRRDRQEIPFGYRSCGLPGDWVILGVGLYLDHQDPAAIAGRIRERMTARKEKQPVSLPSAGSIFKNPPGDYAGRLIEAAGMKGVRIGDAEVSRVHANFIVNRGRARAADVLALIRDVRERVQEKFGVLLELEIEMFGDFQEKG
jgi:UDP-N-acetylmuramate dehydrogenase